MYQILAADDEELMRAGLAKYLAVAGIFEVDLAEDGEQALQMLENKQYDAVILDIAMPKISGLQVLSRISENNQQMVKIIISGHDNFNFAQEAIRYGVSEFLLKPLTPPQIQEFAVKLEGMILKAHLIQEQQKKLTEEIEVNHTILLERFLETLISGIQDMAALPQQMKYYSLKFEYRFFRVAIINSFSKQGAPEIDELQRLIYVKSLVNFINATNKDMFQPNMRLFQILAFNISGGRSAVIINFERPSGMDEENIEDYFIKKIQEFMSFWDIDVFAGFGNVYENIAGLRHSYEEAGRAYRWNILERYAPLVFFNDLSERRESLNKDIDYEEMIMKLKFAKADEVVKMFEQIWEVNIRNKDFYSTRILSIKLLLACIDACQSLDVQLDIEEVNSVFRVIGQEIDKLRIPAKETMVSFINKVCLDIGTAQNRKSGYFVEMGKKIIESHYTADIKVSDVAEKLGLSKNYFGKLFKNSTGVTVSNYVNNLRIKKAIELLTNTNMKIYEVGDAVGFTDQHYFSIAFKQIVGVSPSDFRELS
jgi:two-component system response regulator YesN